MYACSNYPCVLSSLLGQLDNITIPWDSVKFGEGTSVGNNYEYDSMKHSLKPMNEGFYFIYIQVTVSCTHKCKAGVLKLDVLEKLTCSVELTADVEKSPVSKKCWTVSQLRGEELITHMTVPKNGLTNWSLDLNNSHFGMFLVDWCSVAAVVRKSTGPWPVGRDMQMQTPVSSLIKLRKVEMCWYWYQLSVVVVFFSFALKI